MLKKKPLQEQHNWSKIFYLLLNWADPSVAADLSPALCPITVIDLYTFPSGLRGQWEVEAVDEKIAEATGEKEAVVVVVPVV